MRNKLRSFRKYVPGLALAVCGSALLAAVVIRVAGGSTLPGFASNNAVLAMALIAIATLTGAAYYTRDAFRESRSGRRMHQARRFNLRTHK